MTTLFGKGLVVTRAWLLGAVLLAAAAAPSRAAAGELPVARDFKADAAESGHRALPILVFFTNRDCPYCHIVESDYLEPMFNSGQYVDKILFRTVNVDDDTALRDFGGRMTTHREFARASNARLTPHVKLLDPDGNELVPGLRGLMTQDFYGGFLESAISDAQAIMQARARPKPRT